MIRNQKGSFQLIRYPKYISRQLFFKNSGKSSKHCDLIKSSA